MFIFTLSTFHDVISERVKLNINIITALIFNVVFMKPILQRRKVCTQNFAM